MTQQDYEQKKCECWEEFKREVQCLPVSRHDVFCAAFDRAYTLGFDVAINYLCKQEKDAEGEEMLTVSRKRVQEIYSYNEEILSQDQTHSGAILLKKKLTDLFGSKCLPDNVDSLDSNVNSSEPKPAEPKEYKHFDNILKGSFREHNRLHIAAMLCAGMLANDCNVYPIDRAIKFADKLISECEKGGEV